MHHRRGGPATRIDGYAPLRDYAAVGDGRTVALVAADGSIDWLPLPVLDSAPLLAALLDADEGGSFVLRPEGAFETERRYLPDTNVLETTFTCAGGRLRVTDAVVRGEGGLLPWFELVRRVECLAGRVPFRWRLSPRFDFERVDIRADRRGGIPTLSARGLRVGVLAHECGEPELTGRTIGGAHTMEEGDRGLLVLVATEDDPMPRPDRDRIERRLDRTAHFWREFTGRIVYEGPWRDEVVRSALVLQLLTRTPTGAIAAAATTSLPERIGGDRNWDYRFAWLRDTSFAMEALMSLGLEEQAHATLTWLLERAARSLPRIRVLYHLDGSVPENDYQVPLEGYRASSPVRVGNGAAGQQQLGNYGDLLDSVWQYVRFGGVLDPETGDDLARVADFVCEVWDNTDSGIWELRGNQRHYTISKLGCWTALTRSLWLAERGQVPPDGAQRWRRTAEEIRRFVDLECWSDRRRAYTFYAGGDELDASVLLASRLEFADPRDERIKSTIDALRRELGDGPLLYRYSGMQGTEGAFVACSFWLALALAKGGRVDEACEVMDGTVSRASDVGLLSEEIDPGSGTLLGNLPQALSHVALINAATELSSALKD